MKNLSDCRVLLADDPQDECYGIDRPIIQSLPGIGVFKDLAALDRYLATRPRPNLWPGTQK